MATSDEDLVKALRESVKENVRLQQTNSRLVAAATEPVAIVSIGCRFPGGIAGPEDFWRVVRDGADVYTPFPEDRGWDLDGLYDPDPDTPGTTYVREGAFLHDAAQFDARFFGISPQEALAMDPQQRQLLEVCWEALERAGIDPDRLRGSDTGVYAGIVHQDYAPDLPGAEGFLSLERALGTAGGITSGRVAYTLGLEGPAVTVDTMCSSSLVAIHLATQALRRGECAMALAGGATVMATPGGFVGFARQRGLAPDGRCKSFAACADGSGWAEGVGVVLLERLSDAQRQGHPVLAVIRGSAVNQDGASNGLTAPNGPSQQRVIRRALAAAGLSSADVDVVEAHGTGTTLGDPIEAQALLATYGQGREPDRPLLLRSVKSVLGHTQAASGVAGVIAMTLALQHGHLPATLHVDAPTPQVDWSAGAVELLTEARPWPDAGRPRRAGVSAFGASGTNAHLILEQAPQRPVPNPPEAGAVLPFVMSAKTATALAGQARRLADFVGAGVPLADVASALAGGRAQMADRAVVVAGTREELRAGLELLAESRTGAGVTAGRVRPGKVAFVFPGQGSQWVGMGRELLDTSPVFAARIAECQQALDPWVDWSLTDVLRGDGAELDRVDVVQPASFAVMVGLAAVWASVGVLPDAVIGHSQGEIAAACVAGALSLDDAARVVALRSQAIASMLPRGGGMASIALSEERVRELLVPWADRLQIAALNGPTAVVVAGAAAALDELAAVLAGQDVRIRRVPVDYASHSDYVEAVRDPLVADLAGLSTSVARIPFYSTVDGRWIGDGDALDAGYWYRNLRHTVRFDPAVRDLIAQDHRVFVEVSAHPVLVQSITDIADELDADAVAIGSIRRDEGGPRRLLISMAEAFVRGLPVDWTALAPAGGQVELPTYAFEHQHYWLTMPTSATSPEMLGQVTSDHPLLGAVVELPHSGGLVLTSRLSTQTHPWLADHRIQGVVLVPGTVYVDLAIRAGDEFGLDTLDELVIEAPLALPDGAGVRVQVAVGAPDATGRRPVEVHSVREGVTGWTRHASGLLSAARAGAQAVSGAAGGRGVGALRENSGHDFTQWPPRGGQREDVEDFYAGLAARGYEYGPAFAGLTAVWRRGEEIFAEAELPAQRRDEVDRFGIHPALLDAALHTNAFHRRTDDRNVLPFAWNGVHLHATGASSLRVRVAPCGPDALSFDAADGTGALVLTMDSLVSRPVSAEQLASGSPGGDSLWQVDWVKLPATNPHPVRSGTTVATSGDVAVLGLAKEMGDALPALAIVDVDDAEPLSLLGRVLAVLQAWLDEPELEPVPLVVVTRGAVPAGGSVTDPAGAAVWGLVRSAQAEYPDRFVLVDVEPGADRERAVAAALATGEPQIAVRDDAVYAPRLDRAPVAGPGSNAGFAAGGTVLVTGGTGVLGALLACHLVTAHGVRHLVLASRRGLAAAGAPELVEELAELGASVSVVPCDVSDRDAVEALLAAVPAEHPLTGVIHAAGVLDDSVIGTLDPRRLAGVFAPKAGALQILDELTRDRPPAVFAAFSSAASVFGSAGQGNYAAANACVDAIISARHAAGLPAVSLAWGLWEQATGMTGGLATADHARLSRGGVRPMPTVRALELFDAGIRSDRPLLVPITLDLGAVRAEAGAGRPVPALLRSLVRVARRTARSADGADGGLARRLAGLSPAARTELLLTIVRAEVSTVLGLGGPDPSHDNDRFGDIGFDSLTAVELRNRLGAATGIKLPATLIFDHPTPLALARHLQEQAGGAPDPEPVAAIAPLADDPVVIVGMACRLPGGIAGPGDLWRLVAEGRDGMSGFPDDRGWNLDGLFDADPDHAGTSYAREGGFLHEAAQFDAAFFGISPREAVAMDPQQRLLLETSWEVLEHAGIDPTSLRGGRVGVFTGLSIHDYLGSLVDVPEEFEGFTTTATAGSVASGRVSYVLGLEGPAVTVDTACSSSLVAIHLAAQALRQGECELALAGGAAVMGSPVGVLGFSRQRGLAADGRCKAFAAAADGTVLSEGVGIVLLERLSDARRNGHRVLATVRGSAVNSDGASNGLTAPNGPSQQRVIRQALSAAGLRPEDIDALEAHGTGTTLGDPIEAQAILATYGRDRPPERPLWIGSVKSNLGHTQAAAGVVGVIKMVEALRHEVLPPTLFVDEPTPQVDWSTGAVALLTEARSWPRVDRPHRVGVSSFGISGTNAHLILEQAPADAPAPDPAPPTAVLPFVVSARGGAALAGQARRLRQAVQAGAPLPGVARTLLTGRALLPHRAVVAARDQDEVLAGLDAVAAGDAGPHTVTGATGSPPTVVFVFPGQGAQRLGMGRTLHTRFPAFAAAFDDACAHLDAHLASRLDTCFDGAVAPSVRDVVFAIPGSPEAALLDQTVYTQAALFAVETALFRLVESWGVRPHLVLGHSIGEITAAHVAGMLSLDDAATLVAARGQLMQVLPPGGAMVAVSATEAQIRPYLGPGVDLAAVNDPSSVVLSGDEDAVLGAAERLRAAGRKVKRLPVSHAFHSARMEPMLAGFAAAITGVTWHPPQIPVVAAQNEAGYWVAHVRRTVRFADGVTTAIERGGDLFVEMGPAAGLSGPVLATAAGRAVCTPALRDGRDEEQTLIAAMAELFVRGVPVDWQAFLPADAPAADLPTYAFDRRHYWLATTAERTDAAGLGQVPAEHPLLAAIVAVPETGGVVGTARLSLRTHPWLAEHRLHGAVVVSGAALVDLALRAGDEVGCAVLDRLTVDTPLVVPPEAAVRLEVTVGAADGDGRRPVAVYAAHSGTWVRHAAGVLSPRVPAGAHLDTSPWPPAGAEPVGTDPAVPALRAMWRRGTDVYVDAALPEDADADRFGLHPLLLDAATQAVTAPSTLSGQWEDVALHARGARRLRARLAPLGGDRWSLDATDETGAPVLTVRLWAGNPVQSRALGATGHDALFRVAWTETVGSAPEVSGQPVAPVATPGDVAGLAAGATVAVLEVDRGREALPLLSEVLAVLQAWQARGEPDGARLAVVTRGGVPVGAAVTDVASAAVWGLVRAAQAETPDRVVLVDIDPDADRDAAVAVALAAGEPQVAVRGDTTLVPRLAPAGPLADLTVGFDPDGTVLVTGGTGSLGGLVARHLVAGRGVRYLVLASRRGARADGAAALVDELSGLGASVTLVACDVADRTQVATLLAGIAPEHPLTAVVHTAGVLDDGVLEAMTPDRIAHVFGPKADGARHLDELTRDRDLAAFVVFSSAAGLLGSAGQANYAAANAYLDGLMSARHAAGRPGTSLSWGLWAQENGLTAHLGAVDQARMSRGGVLPLAPNVGLDLFDTALSSGEAHLVPIKLDVRAARADAAAGGTVQPLLRTLVRVPRRGAGSGDGGELVATLAALSAAEQETTLLALVRSRVAAVLGHASGADVEPDTAFLDAGMDSLTAVELRNRLGATTGAALPATLVYDYPTPRELARFLRDHLAGVEAPAGTAGPTATAATDDEVVVVGLGCRMPGGVGGPEEFWDLLVRGAEGQSALPRDRGWDVSGLAVRAGGFLADAAGFDAGFFGVSPREAAAMDPQQRLLLEVVWEAFEDAGLDPAGLRGSDVGVFVGVMGQGYGFSGGGPGVEGLLGTGGAVSVVSGRVSYLYGFTGPSVSVDTACSSSLVAMHLAMQSLRAGECSLAVVGGVTVMATPGSFVEFARQGGLATDGRCKAFAAAADGTGWGEGVGVVLLERASDAHVRGHEACAVVRGSAVNQDGASNGLTAPNGPSQQRVIRRALAMAGVSTGDVDVVEAHGTGTRLGDPIEAQALLATYGRDRDPDRPLWLGSVKSNIGHTQAAAGVAGIIKMVLALRHGLLPATLHVDSPTPEVDWSSGAIRLLTEARPWPVHPDRPRRAGVSSFGVSGTNAHLILEEAPRRHSPAATTDGALPYVLSARTGDRLAAIAASLAELAGRGEVPLPAMAATLAYGRSAHQVRAAVIASDRAELVRRLGLLAAGAVDQGVVTAAAGAGSGAVFVFPGHGGQWSGMGRELVVHSPVFAAWVERCDALLTEFGCEWTFAQVLRGEQNQSRVDVLQPAAFVMMVGLALVWASAGVTPDAVLGSSQGEIAAACVAGLLSVEDALRIVVLRSRLVAGLPGDGTMITVGAGADRVAAMLAAYHGRLEIAAVNGPATVVVSGRRVDIDELTTHLNDEGIWVWPMEVAFASHSHLVDGLEAPLLACLDGVGTPPPGGLIPGTRFYSTVDARWIGPDERLDAGYWFRNLRSPVGLDPAIRAVTAETRAIIEISAHPVLVPSLLDTIDDMGTDATAIATLHRGDGSPIRMLTSVAEAFAAGLSVDWTPFVATLDGHWHEVCHRLPTYPFDRRRYWLRNGAAGTAALGLTSPEHPLLGALVELPQSDGAVFASRLSLDEQPWLADHTVGGRAVVPGSVWVELAIRAGDELDCGFLDTLDLEVPLLLAPDAPVRLQVCVDRAGQDRRRQITVHSAPTGHPARPVWTRHAVGVLAPTAPEPRPDTDGTHWPPAGAEPVDPAGFHTGTGSGPAFQSLRAAWRRGAEVFAEVTLPPALREDAARYGIHPALLDATTHLAGFAPGEVPTSWRHVTLHAAGASSLRVRLVRAADGTVTLDASDDVGAPVLRAGRVTARPAVIEPAAPRDDVLRIAWAPLDAGRAGAPVTIVTIEDSPALADGLSSVDGPAAGLLTIPAGDEPAAECGRVLAIAQEWLDEPDLEPHPLVVLTHGAVAIDGEAADPASAAVWGMIAAIQVEYPGRLVLVDAEPGAAAVPKIPDVLAAKEPQAAVRAGTVLLPRLAPAGPAGVETVALNPGGTVVVIGGTGAAGARAARHLVAEHGVRHLVLASRRGPGDDTAALAAEFAALGARATVAACDASDPDALKRLLADVPELTGVVHAAGVPDHTPLAELDADRMAEVLAARTVSLRHLDELTGDRDLALFMVVVSTAGLLGPASRAATAAADGYARAIVSRRRAAGRTGSAPMLLPTGATPDGDPGTAALAAAVRSGEPFGVPGRPERWAGTAAGTPVPALLRGLVRPRRRLAHAAGGLAHAAEVGDTERRWLADRLAGRSAAEREAVLLELVCTQAGAVLGLDATEQIQSLRGFFELGLDSLMAVELCRRLGGFIGTTLTPSAVFTHPTPAALTGFLLERLPDA